MFKCLLQEITGFSVFTSCFNFICHDITNNLSVSQDAIKAVPDSIEKPHWNVGSTHWQTIRHIIFPSALPGIITNHSWYWKGDW